MYLCVPGEVGDGHYVSQRNSGTQAPSDPESGGTGSRQGPCGLIRSQKIAPVATGIPSLFL